MTTPHTGTKILVPLDGSKAVHAALEPAAELAASAGGELVLTVVVNDVFERMVTEFIHHEHATPEQAANVHLTQAENELRDAGYDIPISREVRTDNSAVDTILSLAEDTGATMIAMTSHGHTGVSKLLLGSVSGAVLEKAPIPVLLVPLEERARVVASAA